MRLSLLIFVLLFLIASLLPLPVSAQSTLEVTPSIMHLNLAEDIPEYTITYKNRSNMAMQLRFEAEDFSDLENGWKIKYFDQNDTISYKYGLSSWISFSSTELLIAPNETASVVVYIDKNKLSPGGHYATIHAKLETAGEDQGNVPLKQIVTSLLFVRADTGGEVDDAVLDLVDLPMTQYAFPKKAFFRFKNTGNTELIPYGMIVIKDVRGVEVTRGIVNEDSLITLPESLRTYILPIRAVGFVFPSLYTASLSLHYGTTNKTLERNTTFFSTGTIPLYGYGIGITIIGILGLVLRRIRLQHRKRSKKA